MFVYVKNHDGAALMPCTEAKARKLLEAGKAKIRENPIKRSHEIVRCWSEEKPFSGKRGIKVHHCLHLARVSKTSFNTQTQTMQALSQSDAPKEETE
jgi:hypothetical protein